MVLGFTGWPDAGKVSSIALDYLTRSLKAEKVMEFRDEALYDLAYMRPLVRIEDGLMIDLKAPSNVLYLWRSEELGKAILILHGAEPSFDWKGYSMKILSICEHADVKRIYMIGGVLDMIPHTRKPKITAVVNMDHLKEEIKLFGLTPSRYEGPASIHSYLMWLAREKGIEAISLWGHASNYIAAPNTITALHLLRKLISMLGISIDLRELEESARRLELEVDEMAKRSPELQQMIKSFEKMYDEEVGAPPYIA